VLLLFSTRDTVAGDTCARRATSWMVAIASARWCPPVHVTRGACAA
jgi:hypothetical protein